MWDRFAGLEFCMLEAYTWNSVHERASCAPHLLVQSRTRIWPVITCRSKCPFLSIGWTVRTSSNTHLRLCLDTLRWSAKSRHLTTITSHVSVVTGHKACCSAALLLMQIQLSFALPALLGAFAFAWQRPVKSPRSHAQCLTCQNLA